MVVSRLPHLNEGDLATKVIHYLLVTSSVPPFDGKIELATRCDDPERGVLACQLLHLRPPRFLHLRQVDVSLEGGRPDLKAQRVVQVINEAENEVIRALVAAVNQRILALNQLDIRSTLLQGSKMGVVLPEMRTRSANVSNELVGVAAMQITDRSSEHHDVTGRQPVLENQLFHAVSSG